MPTDAELRALLKTWERDYRTIGVPYHRVRRDLESLIRPQEPEREHGPYYIENDDSLKPNGVFRIVPRSAYERVERLKCSARPVYIATVYDATYAEKIAELLNRELRAQEPEQRKCSYCNAIEPGWRDGQCQACGEPSK